MFRSLLTYVLVFGVALLGMEPVYGQYQAPPPPQYPAQQYPPQSYPQNSYPQEQYPQNQGPSQYPQIGQYPPARQYPQGPQDPNAQDAAVDQQHGVARISIVQGDVNVKRGDNGELVAAVTNAPLMAQDHLQTSPGSRAEVELDYGNLVRLAPNTDIGFADLQYRRYQIQLGAGTVVYRVLRNSNAQTEIDTPSIAVRPALEGEYRISVLDDGTTQITVRSGQAEIFSPRGSQALTAGHTILVRGNPSDPEFQQGYEIARDQFDDWCANRDRDLLASQSYRYVSPDVYGADDLDAYGNWVPSQYGQVWQPQPPSANWSPYSDGQWAYEPYYGWTWIDYAPWGWAPYHYGRWFWNGGHGWCWWPGGIRASYSWSPALVGFFGWGGFGIGLGGLGWVALAPFESFHPWWRHDFGYRRYGAYGLGGFGAFRNANIAAMYRNAAIRGGAITAPYNAFGGPNQRFSIATRAQLVNATFVRGQIPVTATRASYQFSNRPAVINPRLASVTNRQFFRPQQLYQAGFRNTQTRGIENGPRIANPQQNMHGVAPNIQHAYTGRSSYTVSPSTSSGGWKRFGDPGTSNTYRQNFTGSQEPSGWHHFGEPQRSTPAYNPGPMNTRPQPNYGQSYTRPNYNGNYQVRPQVVNPPQAPQRPNYSSPYGGTYNAPRPNYSTPQYNAPHYNAPSMPHYSAPSAPHYSAPPPSSRGGGGGGSRGGGSPQGGTGGHSGGGGRSSSGGHHGR
jgi:uncharacterized membrane protein YgcG